MDYKYRVDFYYWKCGSGFSHVETIEKTNTIIKANDYVNNIDIDYYLSIPYDAIWVKVVDNENDYVVSELWWKNKDIDNKEHDKNWWTRRCLRENNVWVFEREAGDGGLVVGETYEDALNELRKVYDDIDERLDPNCGKYTWGLSVLSVNDYHSEGNVFITHPY